MVEDYISTERLDIYSKILKVDEKDKQYCYQWNKELTASIVPLLQCLEVSLRNSINNAIKNHPPTGCGGLYRTDSQWIYELPRYLGDKTYIRQNKRYQKDSAGNIILDKNGKIKYKNMIWEEKEVKKTVQRILKSGKSLTPERVISEMTFGFWVCLLGNNYNEPRNKTLLWPELTNEVFPDLPSGLNISDVEKRIKKINEFRNRVSHHEAVWKFHYETNGITDYSKPVYGINASLNLLKKTYEDILEVLGWISHERRDMFINEGHDKRFYSLCSHDGFYSFVNQDKIKPSINIKKIHMESAKLIRLIRSNKIYKIVDGHTDFGVFGPDFSKRKNGMDV